MDAWTFVADWWQRFGSERVLHATAHDVLMAAPGLGDYFRQVGVIPASRQGVSAALSAGCDVIIWPGGEVDAMRNWRRRDEAVLGGRMGSSARRSAQACRSFPSPASAGMTPSFVLSEGRWIANGLENIPGLKGLKEKLRGSQLPIVLGIPFGLTIESDSDAPSAASEDPHRAARPDSPRQGPRAGQRSRLRQLDLPRSGIRDPERNEPTRQETALPDLRLAARRRTRQGGCGQRQPWSRPRRSAPTHRRAARRGGAEKFRTQNRIVGRRRQRHELHGPRLGLAGV